MTPTRFRSGGRALDPVRRRRMFAGLGARRGERPRRVRHPPATPPGPWCESSRPVPEGLAGSAGTGASSGSWPRWWVRRGLRPLDLPLDVQGTAFQSGSGALRRIPAYATVTYREIARRRAEGRPSSRAACAERLAVAIPCHRVVRSDGALGYRWGVERKRALLAGGRVVTAGNGHPGEGLEVAQPFRRLLSVWRRGADVGQRGPRLVGPFSGPALRGVHPRPGRDYQMVSGAWRPRTESRGLSLTR